MKLHDRFVELKGLLNERGVAWLLLIEGSTDFESALVVLAKAAGADQPELVLNVGIEHWREGISG